MGTHLYNFKIIAYKIVLCIYKSILQNVNPLKPTKQPNKQKTLSFLLENLPSFPTKVSYELPPDEDLVTTIIIFAHTLHWLNAGPPISTSSQETKHLNGLTSSDISIRVSKLISPETTFITNNVLRQGLAR